MRTTKSERRRRRAKQRERRWWKRTGENVDRLLGTEGTTLYGCDVDPEDDYEMVLERHQTLVRRVSYGGRKGRRAERRLFAYETQCLWMP